VFIGLADRHQRQHEDGQVVRDLRHRPLDDAAIYSTVHPDRQMGAMLFDGADRKHGDCAFGIKACKFLGRQVLPVAAPRSSHEPPSLKFAG
jgi:hypothetical protein